MTAEEARVPAPAMVEARDRAEQVARASYGRLLAILAARSGDIEVAEDALADAFAKALAVWGRSGVPENPEAWLLTAARNRRRDTLRSAARHPTVPLADASMSDLGIGSDVSDPGSIPDRRLALLFVCAHPGIEAGVRMPLMLQTVLGFTAKEIARALVVPTSTMAQRLVRAKRRIRDARIPFVVPERPTLEDRLPYVLEAIYGAFAIDWQQVSGATVRESTAVEALFLAETLAGLLEDEPETLGLASLLSFCMARARARRSSEEFVPLDEQDVSGWDARLIARGERYLGRARALGSIGRFQLEAAIQSVHCARSRTGVTDWRALRTLYAGLVVIAPTLGARVAHAVAVGRTLGPEAGLAAFEDIENPSLGRFQPGWTARAHLLIRLARFDEGRRAYEKAISLTADIRVRRYLEARLRSLEDG